MGLSYATKHTKGDPINVSNNNNSTLVTHLGVLARKAEKRRVFVCAFVCPQSFERLKNERVARVRLELAKLAKT